MSDYLSFEGEIISMPWGDSVYTVLPVPDDIAEILATQNARRIEGEINDHPINLALTKAPVIDGTFLWTGKSLLREIGISPGEPLEIRLRRAPDDAVDVPEDIMLALRQAEALDVWDALTPGKQRSLLYQIKTAKRAETRIKRIAKMIAEIS